MENRTWKQIVIECFEGDVELNMPDIILRAKVLAEKYSKEMPKDFNKIIREKAQFMTDGAGLAKKRGGKTSLYFPHGKSAGIYAKKK